MGCVYTRNSCVFQSVNIAGGPVVELCVCSVYTKTLASFWAALKRPVLAAAPIYTLSGLPDKQKFGCSCNKWWEVAQDFRSRAFTRRIYPDSRSPFSDPLWPAFSFLTGTTTVFMRRRVNSRPKRKKIFAFSPVVLLCKHTHGHVDILETSCLGFLSRVMKLRQQKNAKHQ